jgi:hypothetical protein
MKREFAELRGSFLPPPARPEARARSRPRWLAFLFPSRLRVQGLRSVEGLAGPALGNGCAGRAHSASEPMGGAEKPYFVSDVHKTDM